MTAHDTCEYSGGKMLKLLGSDAREDTCSLWEFAVVNLTATISFSQAKRREITWVSSTSSSEIFNERGKINSGGLWAS